MHKFYICVLVICLMGLVNGNFYKEDKYYDKEIVRQVANWLVHAMRNTDLTLCHTSGQKKNSEIITSILGLPKNLNDAGRK